MNYATNFTGIRLDFSWKNAVEVLCFLSRMIWNGGTILLNCIYSLFFKFFFLRLQVIQKKWKKKFITTPNEVVSWCLTLNYFDTKLNKSSNVIWLMFKFDEPNQGKLTTFKTNTRCQMYNEMHLQNNWLWSDCDRSANSWKK